MESGWAKICAGDYYKGFEELCSVSPLAKEALISTAMQYLGQDMTKLLKYNKRLQRLENAQDLQMFSWEEVLHEANDLSPDLVTFIDHLLQQGRHISDSSSAGKVKRPNVAVGMIMSLLLHFQDPVNYRATQQIMSLMLHLSGCKEQLTYLSLSHLGVCLGPASTHDFVSRFKSMDGLCETFKSTDMGTLGNNAVELKQGSLAQKRKERDERKQMSRQLKVEEMEVEDEWKEQLRQAGEELGLDEKDLCNDSDSDDSEDSTAESDTGSITSDDDHYDFEFYEEWKRELKQAAEAMGVAKEDLISEDSLDDTEEHSSDDGTPDVKDPGDDSEVKIVAEEIVVDDDCSAQFSSNSDDEENLSQGQDVNEVIEIGDSNSIDEEKEEDPYPYGNHAIQVDTNVEQYDCANLCNAENGFSRMALESTSPARNGQSVCVQQLSPANSVKVHEIQGYGGGRMGRMEVDVGLAESRLQDAEDSPECFSSSWNKKRFSQEPVSPPKRSKPNEDNMEDPNPR